MPGSPTADAADERGLAALAILRAMGLPTLVGLVQEPNNSLKEKSAAKKRGRALLDREVRIEGWGQGLVADQIRDEPTQQHRRVCSPTVSVMLWLPHSASCWLSASLGTCSQLLHCDQTQSRHLDVAGTKLACACPARGAQVPGQHAVFTTADGSDTQQLARHLAEVRLAVPQWRQQRSGLMVQSAQYLPAVGAGTLLLRYAIEEHVGSTTPPRATAP